VTDNQKSRYGPLVRAGAAICAAGAAVAATALATRIRRWVKQLETTPPREFARQRWTRAKAASAAAADTWRNGHPAKQATPVEPAEPHEDSPVASAQTP